MSKAFHDSQTSIALTELFEKGVTGDIARELLAQNRAALMDFQIE